MIVIVSVIISESSLYLGANLHVLVGCKLGRMLFQMFVMLFLDEISVNSDETDGRDTNEQEEFFPIIS